MLVHDGIYRFMFIVLVLVEVRGKVVGGRRGRSESNLQVPRSGLEFLIADLHVEVDKNAAVVSLAVSHAFGR